MSHWGFLPGETPIDVSGLKRKGINTRAELNRAEAENIRKAVVKYLAANPPPLSTVHSLLGKAVAQADVRRLLDLGW